MRHEHREKRNRTFTIQFLRYTAISPRWFPNVMKELIKWQDIFSLLLIYRWSINEYHCHEEAIGHKRLTKMVVISY